VSGIRPTTQGCNDDGRAPALANWFGGREHGRITHGLLGWSFDLYRPARWTGPSERRPHKLTTQPPSSAAARPALDRTEGRLVARIYVIGSLSGGFALARLLGTAGQSAHSPNERCDLAPAGSRLGSVAAMLEGVSVTLRSASQSISNTAWRSSVSPSYRSALWAFCLGAEHRSIAITTVPPLSSAATASHLCLRKANKRCLGRGRSRSAGLAPGAAGAEKVEARSMRFAVSSGSYALTPWRCRGCALRSASILKQKGI
jgi:hypothetical protein